ncbi:hypothetical protein ESCAB7627_4140 [Escherichia albertii TW07627]|uniref:Uncharacterized protein n=1 Tax=Escherichia albertii (strain TW07627) TaxID=502347 RepID=A0ABC9NIG4_ESCAT|nr:hypothetical protein ESCAB7627_4140 [Escherichia albertii TW07627]
MRFVGLIRRVKRRIGHSGTSAGCGVNAFRPTGTARFVGLIRRGKRRIRQQTYG